MSEATIREISQRTAKETVTAELRQFYEDRGTNTTSLQAIRFVLDDVSGKLGQLIDSRNQSLLEYERFKVETQGRLKDHEHDIAQILIFQENYKEAAEQAREIGKDLKDLKTSRENEARAAVESLKQAKLDAAELAKEARARRWQVGFIMISSGFSLVVAIITMLLHR